MPITLNGSTGITTPGLTNEGSQTITGGTANGVAYLDGSKVLTTGSALTFDGENLTFNGSSAPRLLANMSGAQSTRFAIQNSATNGNTRLFLYPNGTGNIAAINGRNSTDTANYSGFDLAVISTSDVRLTSGAEGTGAVLPISFYLGASEAMRLTSTGLGIGTSSPAAKVHSTSSSNQLTISEGSAFGATFDYQSSTGNLSIATNGINPRTSAQLVLTLNGNLGLGVTAPLDHLHVHSASNTTMRVSTNGGIAQLRGYVIGNNATDTNEYGSLKMELSGGELRLTSGYSGFGGYTTFHTNGSERARITSGGDLLVGTSGNPAISGVTASHAFVQTVSSRWVAGFVAAQTTQWGIAVSYASSPNNASQDFIWCTDSTTQRFGVRSNGGIANYSANDVNLSDRREKTNFAPAKSYLETICAIPVQTFNYIDQNIEDDPGKTLGVVAQDVQAVAPELVMESNWGTAEEPKMRLSIYQTDLQYALMKCIQELNAKVEAQAAEIAALKGVA